MQAVIKLHTSNRRSLRFVYVDRDGSIFKGAIASYGFQYKRDDKGVYHITSLSSRHHRTLNPSNVMIKWQTGKSRVCHWSAILMDLDRQRVSYDKDFVDALMNIAQEGKRSKASLLALKAIQADDAEVRLRYGLA